MTRKWVLAAVAAGLLSAGSGCVTCCHTAAKAALEAGPSCDVPACDRGHVYAVLVNGLTPGCSSGLEGLRDRLADQGFAKAYYGQLAHAGWFGREMKQALVCDPAARFVVVGYDAGCAAAVTLARDAVAAGIPVDAVVFLDPVGTPAVGGCPARTVLVGCGGGTKAPHTERVNVPGANHFTLPTHPMTVELVCGLMKESAARVEHPPGAVEEWHYDFAPPPRNVLPPDAGAAPEWLFLHEHPGYQPAPLTPLPQSLPAPIAPALIPRGGYAPPVDLPRPQPGPFIVPVPVPAPAPGQPQPLPTPKPLPQAP